MQDDMDGLFNFMYQASGNKLDLPQSHLTKNNSINADLLNFILRKDDDDYDDPLTNLVDFASDMGIEGNEEGATINIPFGRGGQDAI